MMTNKTSEVAVEIAGIEASNQGGSCEDITVTRIMIVQIVNKEGKKRLEWLFIGLHMGSIAVERDYPTS